MNAENNTENIHAADTDKPILLFPVGTDAHGRPTFTGIEFDSLEEINNYQKNVHYISAMVISNATLYDIKHIEQAMADR